MRCLQRRKRCGQPVAHASVAPTQRSARVLAHPRLRDEGATARLAPHIRMASGLMCWRTYKTATILDDQIAMHDIRWIRENAAEFDRGAEAARARRDQSSLVAKLLALDERRRAAILKSEQAQARRNAASKEIGEAKEKKDEAAAQKLMAEVNELKDDAAGAGGGGEGGRGGAEQDSRDDPEPAARRSAGRQGRDRQRRASSASARSATTRSSRSSISSWAKRSA